MFNLETFSMSQEEIVAHSRVNSRIRVERARHAKPGIITVTANKLHIRVWIVYSIIITILALISFSWIAIVWSGFLPTGIGNAYATEFPTSDNDFLEREKAYYASLANGTTINNADIASQYIDLTPKQKQLLDQIHGNFIPLFDEESGVYYNEIHKYTYYSSKVKRHWRTYQWIPDPWGFWHDKDGYFVVAADFDDYHNEPEIWTDMGWAKIYDCGTGGDNIIDFYVNW